MGNVTLPWKHDVFLVLDVLKPLFIHCGLMWSQFFYQKKWQIWCWIYTQADVIKDVLIVLIFLKIILEYKLYTVLPSKIHTSLIVYIFCWIWLHNFFYWSVVGFDWLKLKLTPGYNSLCTSTLTQNKQSNLLANGSNKYTSNIFFFSCKFNFELLYSSVYNIHMFCSVNYLTSKPWWV
jgi:hypothetical protein